MSVGSWTDEEVEALRVLAERNRLLVTIVPEGASDRFVASLSVFVNYLLDIQLLPVLPLPAVKSGDGLVCPYCGVPASTKPEYENHAPDCRFRQAIERWAAASMQIDQEFPA